MGLKVKEFRVFFGLLWFVLLIFQPIAGLRPLRERARSWGDEWLVARKDENEVGPLNAWNITGTYRGAWRFIQSSNTSSRFPDFKKSSGNSVLELITRPTKINGVHYVQGVMIFHDVFDNEPEVGRVQIRVEGVYIWPFRQLRMVANSGREGEFGQEEDYILSNPYHLLGVFSSQVFQESPHDKIWKSKHSAITDMDKHCNVEISAQISRVSSTQTDGEHDRYYLEGLMESPSADDDGDCFSPMIMNATSVNIEVYYNKAVNYTLMVTFVSEPTFGISAVLKIGCSLRRQGVGRWKVGVKRSCDVYICDRNITTPFDSCPPPTNTSLAEATSDLQNHSDAKCWFTGLKTNTIRTFSAYQISFLQVLLLIRQMEHSNTQSGAAKVSILMIGQQAIMDAYLCLLHLTAGILVESLFNAFATAAFFKFVVFSIFEMRYLLAIWKASRSTNNGEGWEAMRRELSVLYSRFYGILLGGILVMYEFHRYLRPILLLLHSFWIPQIVTNIVSDSRKPLHPHYIIGMSLTRLAIPLYVFGCPHNFMRIEPDKNWCISLSVLVGVQAAILILQHYLGSRCFIPRQILPEKYCYFRRVDQDSNHATDCVICMTAIDLTQHSNDCMVTPCDHFFHSGCLQRWMDIKMECPTCRRALPPA